MLSTKNILSLLSELGLNKYEAKVYLTLIAEGTSTAKNISDITGIPYGKVYEIINSLANRGFSIVLPTKPMKCQAVSPKEAIFTTKKQVAEKYDKLEKEIVNQIEPMFAEGKQFKEPKSIVWVINGRANVVKKMESLIKAAKHSIRIYTSASGLSRLLLHKETLEEAYSKGVVIDITAETNKRVLEEAQSLLKFCNIRHIPEAQNHIFSIDSNECLIVEPIPDDDNILYGRDLGMWVRSKPFVNFLDKSFMMGFRKARKIAENGAK